MLNNLSLKPIYSTEVDDMANDFYIPVLSEAISYKRVSGYFSSSALSLFAKGIEQLAFNKGTYRLLVSNEISEKDFELIKSGYRNKKEAEELIRNHLSDYDILDRNQKKDFSNLAYLIGIGVVEVKIGFTPSGLFHSKYGIFTDSDANKVYFSGSLNETRAAFLNNFESITLVNSWSNREAAKSIETEEKKFDDFWNGKNQDNMIFVKEFNELLKSSLIKYSKGKIVMDASLMSDDALIFFYENKKLQIQNNLHDKEIDTLNRQMKKIQNQYLVNGKFWDFREKLTYLDIEKVNKLLIKFGERTQTKIVISDSVYDYIESQKFMISEISDRGLMIKNRDPLILDSFNRFRSIVSQETTRGLREIQAWVSFYMTNMQRVGNFSVPGAGKTAMIYGTFAYLSSQNIDQVDQIVVIGPKSSFKSWKDEFKLVFGRKRKLNVLDIHSKDFHPRMLTRNTNNYNLLLINYESLEKYEEDLNRIVNSRTMLVFDEVHKIKGISSKRAPLAISLAQNAKYRFVLTGTPLPNGYVDIWNMLHILFNNEYKTYFGYQTSELANMSGIEVNRFNEKLFPFYWRVNKNELEVPKANEDHIYKVNLSDKEQVVVDLLWKKYRRNPLVLYIRLIQFSSNPGLLKKSIKTSLDTGRESDDESKEETNLLGLNDSIDDDPNYTADELEVIDSLKNSSKFDKAILKADSLMSDNKIVIIWCIFIDTMKKVAETLENRGYRVALIYGETPATVREEMISEFQNGLYDVLVTNPHTLAESISLHRVCHDAIYLEYSFNLTHMLQSRDRIHRLGLEDNDETNYYYYLSYGQEGKRNTIDEKIYNRLREKEELMLEAVEGTELPVNFSDSEKNEILEMMEEYI